MLTCLNLDFIHFIWWTRESGQAKEGFDALRLSLEIRKRVFDRSDQVFKNREVFQVSRLSFYRTPEILNRVVVRRIAGQLEDCQACHIRLKEVTGCLGRMIACTI